MLIMLTHLISIYSFQRMKFIWYGCMHVCTGYCIDMKSADINLKQLLTLN